MTKEQEKWFNQSEVQKWFKNSKSDKFIRRKEAQPFILIPVFIPTQLYWDESTDDCFVPKFMFSVYKKCNKDEWEFYTKGKKDGFIYYKYKGIKFE